MYQDVIRFWFDEINQSQWFAKDDALDQLIRARFSTLHSQATRGELFAWRETALGCLAEVILLDQFSRNMFRDEPRAFAYDTLALVLAQTAIAQGVDAKLNDQQKSFLYMPFMHSESLVIHHEAVKLFTQLGVASNLDFELRHKAIIEQFGRYPHRNKILARRSTEKELAFLSKPNSSF